MNRRKQFRAVATRYDKLALRYQATVAVADLREMTELDTQAIERATEGR